MGESRSLLLVEVDIRSNDTTEVLANFFHLRMRTSTCARARHIFGAEIAAKEMAYVSLRDALGPVDLTSALPVLTDLSR
jgi:hypothetical protein